MSNTVSVENMDILLKYLPVFKNEKFNSIDKKLSEKGDISFMLCYSKEVNSFVEDLYKSNFLYSFDWLEWQNEASNYFENPELLENANIEIIQKLLTLHIRKERFCEGHLLGIINSGHMVDILKRLKKIRDQIFLDSTVILLNKETLNEN